MQKSLATTRITPWPNDQTLLVKLLKFYNKMFDRMATSQNIARQQFDSNVLQVFRKQCCRILHQQCFMTWQNGQILLVKQISNVWQCLVVLPGYFSRISIRSAHLLKRNRQKILTTNPLVCHAKIANLVSAEYGRTSWIQSGTNTLRIERSLAPNFWILKSFPSHSHWYFQPHVCQGP